MTFNMNSIDKTTNDRHDRMTETTQEMWTLKLQIHIGFKFRKIYAKLYMAEATNMCTFYLLLNVLTS